MHDYCIRPTALFIGPSGEGSPMTAYKGLRVFSHVVIALMAGGIAYAAYIAVTYWTGISV